MIDPMSLDTGLRVGGGTHELGDGVLELLQVGEALGPLVPLRIRLLRVFYPAVGRFSLCARHFPVSPWLWWCAGFVAVVAAPGLKVYVMAVGELFSFLPAQRSPLPRRVGDV